MILQKPTSNDALHLFELDRDTLPPAGTFAATIIDIRDRLGVERQKFQSDEMEVVDLTAFLFGWRTPDGTKWKLDTRPMKISGHTKSALYKFLTGLMGKPPAYGWDYLALKGTKCLLTVAHLASQSGTTYAAVTSAVPLPAGWGPAAVPAPPPPPPPPVEDDADEGEVPF